MVLNGKRVFVRDVKCIDNITILKLVSFVQVTCAHVHAAIALFVVVCLSLKFCCVQTGASEVVDLVEDQPGEAAGPSQQPKGQLKQPQTASAASDAPHNDSQSHDDDDIHQAGQLNGQAKLPSRKRGISTRKTQAQPAAARRQANRQPNGKAQAGNAPATENDAESDHDVGHGNDRYEPTENKVERRSKSGLVVEMEEI